MSTPKRIEVTPNTPQPVKELNSQVSRLAESHARMVAYLNGYNSAIESGESFVAETYRKAMQDEIVFVEQVATATAAKLSGLKGVL